MTLDIGCYFRINGWKLCGMKEIRVLGDGKLPVDYFLRHIFSPLLHFDLLVLGIGLACFFLKRSLFNNFGYVY